MPKVEAIINGNFNWGNVGWSGTDLETNHRESAYLANGSSNRVAEMDGRRGQTTVMEQVFNVGSSFSTELSIDSALRNASLGQAGSEGFRAEILDAAGNPIASAEFFPTTNSYNTFTLPVTFTGAGAYRLRLTELGPDNSLGAIIDNVSLLVCFCDGTLISTPSGQRPVEALQVGDMVLTSDGPKALRWIGRRSVTREELAKDPKLRPVQIRPGALGDGLPLQKLRVSRQHRMVSSSRPSARMFGPGEVLIPAVKLAQLPGISVENGLHPVTYYHLMFDDHVILYANGAPSESFLVTQNSLGALTEEAREELLRLFPDLTAEAPPALPIPRRKAQNTYVARLLKNAHPPLDRSA
jgi:hypothetical protein